ncbi:hypothetical protein [Mycoplasmopsis felis]|uniref:hypothetical protein n=1 Tax=Mycoplasmopsis felis TaxID=33923 RepID=UPI002DD445C3|nr:hypothetical protein [Mycoplasmopsis felis]WRX06733.1 hypothetical protein O7984_00480 [Mycoplasmopsis felis]
MSLYWGLFNSPFINFSVELISELINSNTFCFFSFLLKTLNSIASFSFFNFSNSLRNSVIACCNEASLFDSSINFNVFAFSCSYLVLIELNLLSLRELSNWVWELTSVLKFVFVCEIPSEPSLFRLLGVFRLFLSIKHLEL